MKPLAIALAAVAVSLSAGAASSHEFWIEGEDYMLEPGDRLVASIRVGQNFKGTSFAYLPQNFRRFDLASQGVVAPVEMRPGDRPAVDVEVLDEGLATLIHVTRDYDLTYDDHAKFVDFLTHKDATWVLDQHAARGYPEIGFTEAYSRYGKALFAVGKGQGEDRAYGLLTEIVALENPYTGDTSDGVDIQVFYEEVPRADARVEVFARDGAGRVEVTQIRTDGDGVATVPVVPGSTYLVDAVLLREPRPAVVESMNAVWESLWASLTFQVPG